jgi:hypothetical protein
LFISFIIPSATKELRRITSFRVVPWKNTGGPVTTMLYAVSDTQSCFNAPIIRKVFKRSIFARKREIEDVGPTRQSYCEDMPPLYFSKLSAPNRVMSALGHKRTYAPQNDMSALPSKADMCTALAYVCFGPKADIHSSSAWPSFSHCLKGQAIEIFLDPCRLAVDVIHNSLHNLS